MYWWNKIPQNNKTTNTPTPRITFQALWIETTSPTLSALTSWLRRGKGYKSLEFNDCKRGKCRARANIGVVFCYCNTVYLVARVMTLKINDLHLEDYRGSWFIHLYTNNYSDVIIQVLLTWLTIKIGFISRNQLTLTVATYNGVGGLIIRYEGILTSWSVVILLSVSADL